MLSGFREIYAAYWHGAWHAVALETGALLLVCLHYCCSTSLSCGAAYFLETNYPVIVMSTFVHECWVTATLTALLSPLVITYRVQESTANQQRRLLLKSTRVLHHRSFQVTRLQHAKACHGRTKSPRAASLAYFLDVLPNPVPWNAPSPTFGRRQRDEDRDRELEVTWKGKRSLQQGAMKNDSPHTSRGKNVRTCNLPVRQCQNCSCHTNTTSCCHRPPCRKDSKTPPVGWKPEMIDINKASKPSNYSRFQAIHSSCALFSHHSSIDMSPWSRVHTSDDVATCGMHCRMHTNTSWRTSPQMVRPVAWVSENYCCACICQVVLLRFLASLDAWYFNAIAGFIDSSEPHQPVMPSLHRTSSPFPLASWISVPDGSIVILYGHSVGWIKTSKYQLGT